MLKSKVSYSKLEDAFSSGKETATKTIEGLTHPKVAFFYASHGNEEGIRGAKEVIGNIPLIGSTSTSIMIPDGLITDCFTGMMMLEEEDMVVSVAGNERGENARETGKRTALEAIKESGLKIRPSYFYLVSSSRDAELYLQGIEDVIGRVPCFGGSISNINEQKMSKIFCNDRIINEGCAVAFFYTTKDILTEYRSTYRETSDMGVITQVIDENGLGEINHQKALEVYAEWLHKDVMNIKGEMVRKEALLSPFAVKDPMSGLLLINEPLYGNEDYTIFMKSHLQLGTAFIRMETTVEECLEDAKQTVSTLKNRLEEEAGAYLFVHNQSIQELLGDKVDDFYCEIKEVVGETPFLMIFTNGEFGYQNHSASSYGNLMLCYNIFGN